MGWYLGALGGQDNHSPDWGTRNEFRTAVLAEELTRESVIDAYLSRRFYATEDKDLHLDLRGTDFQRRVWDQLCRIPYGTTCSYQDVARAIGRPSAVRAVGTANGANPLPLIVPCHRVVATGGKLGGYGGGLDLKRRLLAMERAEPGLGALL